jgi:hypothetical protein
MSSFKSSSVMKFIVFMEPNFTTAHLWPTKWGSHITIAYVSKMNVNVIFPSTDQFPKWFLLSRGPNQLILFHYARVTFHPSHI